jgi:molybdopterin synthase catalytic subunit
VKIARFGGGGAAGAPQTRGVSYDGVVQRFVDTATWLELTPTPLAVGEISAWAVRPDCGAVVTFNGVARDHAGTRSDVTHLEFEAYEEQVVAVLRSIVEELRQRFPSVRTVAMVHRVGRVAVTESAVVVAVGAPHRDEAFAAASFGIDELKRRAPLWKREFWAEGADWALEPQHSVGVQHSAAESPAAFVASEVR